MYINDLQSVLETCQFLIFADDTKCFKQINSMSDTYQLQEDLTSLLKWSIDNHLHFNISKFVFIHFHPKFNAEYNIDGSTFSAPQFVKTLVLPFLITYPGKKHHEIIISKAYKSFGLLRQTFSETCCSEAKKLYISIVRSTLLYCSSLWQPHQLNHKEAIEQVGILISKNQALQILYLKHCVYKTT